MADDEIVEGAMNMPLGDDEWISEYGVSLNDFFGFLHSRVPCVLCGQGARAQTLSNEDAAASNARFDAFLRALASTPLTPGDCTTLALAVWGFQLSDVISDVDRRHHVLRHILRCGVGEWATRWRIRLVRRTAATLLHNMSSRVTPDDLRKTFDDLRKAFGGLSVLVDRGAQHMSFKPPGATDYTIVTAQPCVFCHGPMVRRDDIPPRPLVSELETEIHRIRDEFYKFCIDGSASVDALLTHVTGLFTPMILREINMTPDQARADVEMHLMHHDNTMLPAFFLLRCCDYYMCMYGFQGIFKGGDDGATRLDMSPLVSIASSVERLPKIKKLIQETWDGARCFGTDTLSCVRFSANTARPPAPPQPMAM